jgi:hypothetical protein
VPGAGHPARPVAGDPGGEPRGVVGDHAPLQRPVLVKTPTTLVQALAAIARSLLGLRGALGLKRLLGLAQPRAAITAVAKPRRQLVKSAARPPRSRRAMPRAQAAPLRDRQQ